MRAWWQELLQGPAAMIGAATALGFVLVSPRQQLESINAKFDKAIAAQVARDSAQDVERRLFKAESDLQMRSVEAALNGLVIAQCLDVKNGAVYAQLECRRRLGR